jgi:predicted ArsR family transcriptional regulator
VERLAEALSEDGYSAEAAEATAPDGRTVLTLRQGHCVIADVAREHPELCQYETAMFEQLLGTTTTRTQTIAGGAGECICHIERPGDDAT